MYMFIIRGFFKLVVLKFSNLGELFSFNQYYRLGDQGSVRLQLSLLSDLRDAKD